MDKLIALPIHYYAALICGFVGYLIAMHGRRKDETQTQLILGSITFGAPAMGLLLLAKNYPEALNMPITVIAAFIISVGCGLSWRSGGNKRFYGLLNKESISNDSGVASTWSAIIQDTGLRLIQLDVLEDRSTNFDRQTRRFTF